MDDFISTEWTAGTENFCVRKQFELTRFGGLSSTLLSVPFANFIACLSTSATQKDGIERREIKNLTFKIIVAFDSFH